MLNPFVCGNFNGEDDEDGSYRNPLTSPRKRNSFCKRSESRGSSKNPYSKRGLDKFSALLAELDEKRRKIYAQMGADDEPLVRFVYKDSDHSVPVPIVINLKDKKEENNKTKKPVDETKDKTISRQNSEGSGKSSVTGSPAREVGLSGQQESETKDRKKNFHRRLMKLSNWRRPSYYLPAIVILILLFLVFFGRSVAIMWTCIGWYLVPTLQGDSSHVRRSTKKKEYVRKLSDNNGMASFKGHKVVAVGNKSPPHAATPITGKWPVK